MADIFENQAANLAGPAFGAFSITPSDGVRFDQPSRAIYVGGAGNLVAEMLDGTVATFSGVPGGALMPIRVVKILAASTASALVGLY